MNEGQYLSIVDVERFLQHKPRFFRDIVLELRNLVASVAPHASERILWGGLSYYDHQRGGPVKAGICQIEIHKDHVRLAFIHGAFLEDPQELLEGNRVAKRYVRLDSYEDAPWQDLRTLIEASAALDPSSLPS
ncbi:MAG TPA: DUF1801 domain-containing protein [Anaerolineae bacterium]|nr:DUF1801 domain-containing protein [Anaerolineae bacterium]